MIALVVGSLIQVVAVPETLLAPAPLKTAPGIPPIPYRITPTPGGVHDRLYRPNPRHAVCDQ